MPESRKTVTIVFTDVTGSTALGEKSDPEVMRRVMERYFDEMRSVLEKHGGTVEKFIGDAVMAVFGIPTVHEDDALRAVRAAAEMRERLASLNEEFERERGITIAVRTGVNTGEVIAGDPSAGQAFATGDAVNVAARLEQAAEPSEIVLGSLTHQLVEEAVRAEPLEPLELKGKAETVEAWRLVEALPQVPAYTRRLDAPFIGRIAELERLRQALAGASSAKTCQLVTVTGPAGIGKSRLVRELITSTGEEARVVVGRCLPYGEGITYWPVAEIIRQIAGSDPRPTLVELLADDPDGALAAERLLGAIGAADEPARTEEIFWAARKLSERLARKRPLIAVVDDIHWAEPTFLDMIEYVVGFARAPILIVCTARPELFDSCPHWPRAGSIELEPLDQEESSVLIDGLLTEAVLPRSTRNRIRERAEGNPLFVEQMLALAAENGETEIAVPATIQALLAARLDHLSEDERAILIRGAVEGRLFHRGAVSALLPEEGREEVPRHLLTLTRKAFLRPDSALFPDDDAFRFAHILVRDAAYEAAPKELRAELHRRFAEWVEERAGEDFLELEEIVGYHLEQSFRLLETLGALNDDARAVAASAAEKLAAAGVRANRRGDYRAAANLLERAYELLEPSRSKMELVSPLSYALYESGRLDASRGLLEDTIAEARAAGLEPIAVRGEVELCSLRVQIDPSWSAEEALALVERAVPLLEEARDDEGLVRVYDLRHDIEWMRGALAAAEEASAHGLALAKKLNDVNWIALLTEETYAARFFGAATVSQMTTDLLKSKQWAHEVGHRALEANATFALGWAAMEQGAFDEGRLLVEQGIAQLEELGLTVHAAGQRAHFRWGEVAREPEVVEHRLRQGYAVLKGVGETGVLSTVAANLAFLLARQGALEEASELARESEATGSPDDITTQVGWRMARALVLAQSGDLAEAEATARDAQARALAAEYEGLIAESHLTLAAVLRLAGRFDEAASAAAVGLAIFERKEMMDSAAAVRAELAELAELQSSGSPSQ